MTEVPKTKKEGDDFPKIKPPSPELIEQAFIDAVKEIGDIKKLREMGYTVIIDPKTGDVSATKDQK